MKAKGPRAAGLRRACRAGAPVEWVELRVVWEVPAEVWNFPVPNPQEKVSFSQVDLWELRPDKNGAAMMQAKMYQRSALPGGTKLIGPAIIMEDDATSYVPTGWKANVTHNGYLRIKADD